MTPAEIKKTRLYRTLAPKIRKQNREEFAWMLAMVPDGAWPTFGETTLDYAFLWTDTPQGQCYWSELDDRFIRYDAGPRAQLPEDFQP